MSIENELRDLILNRYGSMKSFALKINMPNSTLDSIFRRGVQKSNISNIFAISDELGISADGLSQGKIINRSDDFYSSMPDNILPLPAMRQIPLLGTIACGTPILAEENLEGYVKMPDHVHADFALRCKGDSMIGARIYDGDLVFIEQVQDVDNGVIAAVEIDSEATLKRIYKYPGKVVLQPENPAFEPLIYIGAELENMHILGKAVAFLSRVK